MTDADPNEDLIGKTFEYLGQTWTVTSTTVYSNEYVNVRDPNGKVSARRANQLRVYFQT